MKPDTLPAAGWLYWTVIGTTCMHVEQHEVQLFRDILLHIYLTKIIRASNRCFHAVHVVGLIISQ